MRHVCPQCGESLAGPGPCPADGHPAAPAEDALLGAMVGSWRIARCLGAGGFGRVYRAVHPAIGGRVAIKVLSAAAAEDRDLLDRFFAEARTVNRIRHDSIVKVIDLAVLPDGRPYIVMEYVDGAPLSQLLHRMGPLPLGTFARLIGEVLAALGAAHDGGIVHRDLKPDNILVTPAGRPVVVDFGVAKLAPELAGRATTTQAGMLLGTPRYVSPEQAAARSVDARSDLYSAAVILFEGVTGRPPFQAQALYELLRMHIEAPPPSPRALRPEVPPELEAVILRGLAKRPSDRFASAAEMAAALAGATGGLSSAHWIPFAVSSALLPAVRPAPNARLTSDTLGAAAGAAEVAALDAATVADPAAPASRAAVAESSPPTDFRELATRAMAPTGPRSERGPWAASSAPADPPRRRARLLLPALGLVGVALASAVSVATLMGRRGAGERRGVVAGDLRAELDAAGPPAGTGDVAPGPTPRDAGIPAGSTPPTATSGGDGGDAGPVADASAAPSPDAAAGSRIVERLPRPSRFDPVDYWETAFGLALAHDSSAALVGLGFFGVDAKGRLPPPGGKAVYVFGTTTGGRCVRVIVSHEEVVVRISENDPCGGSPMSPPRCSLAQACRGVTRLFGKHSTAEFVHFRGDGWGFSFPRSDYALIADDCEP